MNSDSAQRHAHIECHWDRFSFTAQSLPKVERHKNMPNLWSQLHSLIKISVIRRLNAADSMAIEIERAAVRARRLDIWPLDEFSVGVGFLNGIYRFKWLLICWKIRVGSSNERLSFSLIITSSGTLVGRCHLLRWTSSRMLCYLRAHKNRYKEELFIILFPLSLAHISTHTRGRRCHESGALNPSSRAQSVSFVALLLLFTLYILWW